jgi:hypothetical protein
MVSNYSSILNHFYFLGRPTIHLDPATETGDYTYCTWKRGKVRVQKGAAEQAVWKIPPHEIGGLRVASFEELLIDLERAFDEPDRCRELASAFVARHYEPADGATCARVLEVIRRKWRLT